MALRIGTCHHRSAPYLAWYPWVSAIGDIIYLICQVTSHDHLIEGSCKLMDENSMWYVITLISLLLPLALWQ